MKITTKFNYKRSLIYLSIFILILAPQISFAQERVCPGLENNNDKVTTIKNPLGFLGICTPAELVTKVIAGFTAIMGIIAVAFLVFSGFKLIVASDEEAIKSAKDSITWSVGGFVVALLAFTIISGAANLIGFQPRSDGDRFVNPLVFRGSDTFIGVLNYIMVNILALIAVVTLLMIVYYGYRYITAAGNEESIEKAKTGLKWSIIGLVIAMMSYAVISIVQRLLFFGP